MKRLLARENVELLSQLAWARVLLAFDFDGTLAPIVRHRDDARMRDETMRLFEEVCRLYPTAVISGRSKTDVAGRLGRAQVKYVMGSHGLEPGADLDAFELEIASARPRIVEALRDCPGVDIEDKRFSLAVHYRRSRRKLDARAAIDRAIAALPIPVRIVPGKQVVNVVPARAPNKGDAVRELRRAEEASTALYVGDDVTDEDVFEIDEPGRLLSVRVGESTRSAASYFLRGQREIDGLLARLVDARSKGSVR